MSLHGGLFEPLRAGALQLRNRIVFAPCTRNRSRLDGVPTDLNVQYYAQRATAGLLITEGTQPSAMGQGYLFTPGLYTAAHVAGWRKITSAVHERGGQIVCQLMHVGRLSDPLLLPDENVPIAPSAVQPDPTARHYTVTCPRPKRTYGVPRALATGEIPGVIEEFRHATGRAVEAGFDGVEIHAGSGYLPMQFLSPNTNRRTDGYGGKLAHRARFLLECTEAMSEVKGPSYVAVKVSPGFTFHDVFDDDAPATYAYVARELSRLGIAYLQVGNYGMNWDVYGLLRPQFDGPLMCTAGLTRQSASSALRAGTADLFAFGQHLIANPDLVRRFQESLPLNVPDASTYYTQGEAGYTDYPFYSRDLDLLKCVDPDAPARPVESAK